MKHVTVCLAYNLIGFGVSDSYPVEDVVYHWSDVYVNMQVKLPTFEITGLKTFTRNVSTATGSIKLYLHRFQVVISLGGLLKLFYNLQISSVFVALPNGRPAPVKFRARGAKFGRGAVLGVSPRFESSFLFCTPPRQAPKAPVQNFAPQAQNFAGGVLRD